MGLEHMQLIRAIELKSHDQLCTIYKNLSINRSNNCKYTVVNPNISVNSHFSITS